METKGRGLFKRLFKAISLGSILGTVLSTLPLIAVGSFWFIAFSTGLCIALFTMLSVGLPVMLLVEWKKMTVRKAAVAYILTGFFVGSLLPYVFKLTEEFQTFSFDNIEFSPLFGGIGTLYALIALFFMFEAADKDKLGKTLAQGLLR